MESRLSSHEVDYIVEGIENDLREDGRSNCDYRHVQLQTGVLANTNGSAKLTLSGTRVLVGIKAELTEPNASNPDQGIIKFFVDCSAVASTEFEGRAGGEDLGNSISDVLHKAYNHPNALDLSSLCLIPSQQCWALNVDALVLAHDGNLLDAISLAARAALSDVKLPAVSVTEGSEGEPIEIEVSDDPNDCKEIDVSGVPVTVTLSKVKTSYVVDCTSKEEKCSNAYLTVSIDKSGSVCSLTKGGGSGTLGVDMIADMIEVAKVVGLKLLNNLDEALKRKSKGKGHHGFL